MTLRSLAQITNQQQLNDALTEIQGITCTQVAGAAAGTKMNIAKLRTEDTVLSVLVGTDAGGAWADDVANVTIQATKATGTLTVAAVANNDTATANGNVYTFKDTPTAIRDVKRTAGDNNANAAALSAAINSYETRRIAPGQPNRPAIVATVSTNVVTLTAFDDGAGNAPAVTNSANAVVTNNNTADVSATCVSVVNGNTLTVNGVVFTAVTTIANANPVPAYGDKADPKQAKVGGVGNTDTGMAAEFVRVINKYDLYFGTLDVIASNVLGVVHLKPRSANKGNIVTLAGTGGVTPSGATLSGGTATGGIKSTTALASKSLFVLWFNKDGK